MNKSFRFNKQYSIAISNQLIQEIKEASGGSLSVSSFVRLAVVNELKRWRSTHGER